MDDRFHALGRAAGVLQIVVLLCALLLATPSVWAQSFTGGYLTTDLPSPQEVGSTIKLSVVSSDTRSYLYKFSVWSPSGMAPRLMLIQPFDASNTCEWVPPAPGNYSLIVNAISEDGAETTILVPYTITEATSPLTPPPAPTQLAVSVSPVSPQPANTPLTVSASAVSSSPVEYAFSVGVDLGAGTQWSQLRGYASSASCAWTPTEAGVYTVSVSARAVSTNGLYSDVTTSSITYTVVAPSMGADDISIARYQGNKKGAISFTFDDGLQGQADYAVPLMNKYQFRGTFFVIAGLTRNLQTDPQVPMPSWESWNTTSWETWQRVAAGGHEIGNHTMTHPQNLTQLSGTELQNQVVNSGDIVRQKIGKQPRSFAYPYNSWNASLHDYVLQYHVIARESQSDYSYFDSNSKLNAKNAEVSNTIANGGWLVPMLHGFAAGEWGLSDPRIFEKHLQYIKSRESDLWVDTYGNVARYMRERDNAVIQVVGSSARSVQFTLTCPTLDPSIYTVPLTVLIDTGAGVTQTSVVPGPNPVTVSW